MTTIDTNTDRELLELAAKAAGLNGLVWWDLMGCFQIPGEVPARIWNPLTDDGEALRLAVKLQLTVYNEHVSAGVAYCEKNEMPFPEVRSGTSESEVIADDYAATRRAIVRAAAEIGKAMP